MKKRKYERKYSPLGEYVDSILKEHELHVGDLCELAGEHRNTVGRILRGDQNPSMRSLFTLADALARVDGGDWEDYAFWMVIYTRQGMEVKDGK